jgi:small subunit ribosomal protein S5e
MAEVETFEEEVLPVESDATLTVAQPAELPEIKLFGRWSCDDVQVSDMSLQVSLLYLEVEVCHVDVVPFRSCLTNSACVMV